MLRDDFVYSEELEKYLVASGGEWDLGLRDDRLYELLGKYIVAAFKGETQRAVEFAKQANAIVKADESFLPDFVLKPEPYKDKLCVPQKTRAFVNNLT